MPQLPKEDIKIVVRSNCGLDLSNVGSSTVTVAIFQATCINHEERREDTVCPNTQQKVVIISTPRRANADRADVKLPTYWQHVATLLAQAVAVAREPQSCGALLGGLYWHQVLLSQNGYCYGDSRSRT
ncbi:hypothetical protein HPB49_022528 [Dermacentor silvarum]|uniref:Uncharacterized protein n=1 Tax=Dermacentor silvarum TaxID=543639 RepID=A0ACB8DGD7_DERSI|nr:hypothetical protein HPB49_022528 [Dermacentor silvarum]